MAGRLTLCRSGRAAVLWPGAEAPRATPVQVSVWPAREGRSPLSKRTLAAPDAADQTEPVNRRMRCATVSPRARRGPAEGVPRRIRRGGEIAFTVTPLGEEGLMFATRIRSFSLAILATSISTASAQEISKFPDQAPFSKRMPSCAEEAV